MNLSTAQLLALKAAILASPECMAVAVTPDMGEVDGGYARELKVADILNSAGWGAILRPAAGRVAI